MNWTEEQLKAIEAAVKKSSPKFNGDACAAAVISELTKPEVTLYAADAIEQLQGENTRLRELLTIASCPNGCTGGAFPDNYGEWVQCQWCYEKKEALKDEQS